MTHGSSNEGKLSLQNEKRNGDLTVVMREKRREEEGKEVVYTILTFSPNLKNCKNKNELRAGERGWETRAGNKRKNTVKFDKIQTFFFCSTQEKTYYAGQGLPLNCFQHVTHFSKHHTYFNHVSIQLREE